MRRPPRRRADSSSSESDPSSDTSDTVESFSGSCSSIRSSEEPPCGSCQRKTEFGTDCYRCGTCDRWFHEGCIVPRPPRRRSKESAHQFHTTFRCPVCTNNPELFGICKACNKEVVYPSLCPKCRSKLHSGCACRDCFSCASCARNVNPAAAHGTCKRCKRIAHTRCLECDLCSQCRRLLPSCKTCFKRVETGDRCSTCGGLTHRPCLSHSGQCAKCSLEGHVPSPHYLGPIQHCRFCSCRIFSADSTFCCSAGKHLLRPQDVEIPAPLFQFLIDHGPVLVERGREVNQLASLASVGVKGPSGHSYPSLSFEHAALHAHGRIYHFSMFCTNHRSHPLLGSAQSYLFVDNNISVSGRFTTAVVAAAADLRQIMRGWNPIVRQIRQRVNFDDQQCSYEEICAAASANVEIRGRLENSATAAGQLLLLFSTNGSPFASPEAVARIRGVNFHWDIRLTNAEYEQASYPIFDPAGSSGWWEDRRFNDSQRDGFRDKSGNRLTLLQYTRYRLCQSKLFSFIPRVLQEWVLDMTCRREYVIQPTIVRFMQQHSTKRVARAHQLTSSASSSLHAVGRRWIVPSSVRGSFAYRREKVEMGMAQVHHAGPPTLFITVTANPFWREIQENLLPGQQWYHDTFLVNLVFEFKLRQFIKDLKSGVFFGGRKAVYVQYVIEFQKRGLPHAHILVRLEGEQPESAVQADQLTSATYVTACPSLCGICYRCRLSKLVKDHMIHRCYPDRCNTGRNPTKCKYGFPFSPAPDTRVAEDGFWLLRRMTADALVVPYNAQMLLKYECHINVLIAAGHRCILYLRKYLSKGPDLADARLRIESAPTPNAAMDLFYQTRCLSASEAMWASTQFSFNGYWPSVVPIKINLPDQQSIVFDEEDQLEDVEALLTKKTHIDQYFLRPPDAEELLFHDFYAQYTVTANDNCRRRSTPVVPFLRYLNFNDKELFSLYTLLKHKTARSWGDLRNGSRSFEEAAIALGVFSSLSSSVSSAVLEDWIERSFPPEKFAQYLATVLVTDTDNFAVLFDHYWEYAVPQGSLDIPLSALAAIAKLLYRDGVDVIEALQRFPELGELARGLEAPKPEAFFASASARSLVDLPPLTSSQSAAVESVIQSVSSGKRLFYINGMAGTGKTTVLRHIIKKLSFSNLRCVSSAFTGAAALLLPNGVTCHRLFGLPADDNIEGPITSGISPRSLAWKILQEAQVFIIDEISMLHVGFLHAIDGVLRKTSNGNNQMPFGNKIVILAGDYHQLAPIVSSTRNSIETATIEASIASSTVFQTFERIILTNPVRCDEPELVEFLSEVAKGRGSSEADAPYGRTSHAIPSWINRSDELPQAFLNRFPNPTHLQYISPFNRSVQVFNDHQLQHYFAEDRITVFDAHYTFPPHFRQRPEDAHQFCRGGVPPHSLRLAVGAPVIIMRNIFVSKGVANGALAFVTELHPHVVTVRMVSGYELTLPRISFTIKIGNVDIIRHQFPLSLGFAATINRVQGRTCDDLIVDLTQPVFAHGQLYVALSRCRSSRSLLIVSPTPSVANVVYPDLIHVLLP